MNFNLLPPDQVEYVEIASLSELPNGDRLYLEIDSQEIVIFNIAGMLCAIGDVCSHDGSPLGDGDLEQYEIICPRHGARFDIRSGNVTALPAVEDIPAFPVRVEPGRISIGLPK